jgi:hypothetical protein
MNTYIYVRFEPLYLGFSNEQIQIKQPSALA